MTVPTDLQVWMDEAALFARDGADVKACRKYAQVVTWDPARGAAFFRWGQALARRGRTRKAIVRFHTALKRGWDTAEVHFELGQAHERLNQSDKALAEYAAAIDADPAFARAHDAAGEIFAARNEHVNASERFEAAVRIDAKYVAAWQHLAESRELLGQTDLRNKAIEKLKGLAAEAKDPEQHLLLARMLPAFGQGGATEHLLLAIQTGTPESAASTDDALSALAEHGAGLAEPERAAFHAEVRKVLEERRDAAAERGWADALMREEQFTLAADQLERLLTVYPESEAGYVFIRNRLRQSDVNPVWRDELLARLQSGVKDRGNAVAHDQWGEVLSTFDRPEEAIPFFEFAAGNGVTGWGLHWSWANALIKLQRFPESLDHVIESIRLGGVAAWDLAMSVPHAHWTPLVLDKFEKIVTASGQPIHAVRWAELLQQLGRKESALARVDVVCAWLRQDANVFGQADLLFRAGKVYRAYERYADAIACFHQAIDIDPGLAAAHRECLQTLNNQEKKEGVVGRLISAARAAASGREVAIDWDQMRAQRAEQGARIERLCGAIVDNLDLPAITTCLDCAWELMAQRQYRAALRLARHACELNPREAEAHYLAGAALAALGNHARAIKRFLRAIKEKSNYFDAHHQLGRSLAALRQYQRADRAFARALTRGTDMTPEVARGRKSLAYQDRAFALADNRDYAQALRVCRKALRLDPDDPWIHFRLAYTYSDMLRYEDALREYARAIPVESAAGAQAVDAHFSACVYPRHNMACLYDARGLYRLAREQWEEAARYYEKGIEEALLQRDADYCANFGYACRALRRFDQAELLIRASVLLDPDNAGLHAVLIDLCRERDKVSTARKKADAAQSGLAGWMARLALGQSATAEPRKSRSWDIAESCVAAARILGRRRKSRADVQTLTEQGELFLMTGDHEKAEEAFRAALKMDGRSARINKGLGKLYLQMNKPESAVPFFQAALQYAPDDLSLLADLARAFAKSKALDRAETTYQKILDTAPSHVDALAGIGEVYLSMADKRAGEPNVAARKDLYEKAVAAFSEAIRAATSDDGPAIISVSVASLHFQRGFARVQLVEASRFLTDHSLIQLARADFLKCVAIDPDHNEARRAIASIDEQQARYQTQSRLEGCVSWVVGVLGLVLFVAAFMMVGFGRPVIQRQTQLTEESLSALEAAKVPMEVIAKLKPIQDAPFATPEKMLVRARELVGKDQFPAVQEQILRQAAPTGAAVEFERVEIGYFALLAFGGLLFMIAGAYLPKLTGLKVPGFHLEKSSAERIESVVSLGISRDGQGAPQTR